MAELKLTIDANKALRDRVEVRTAERDAAVAHLRAVLDWSNTERFAGRTRHENDAPSSARSFLDGLDELQTSPKTSKDLDLCDECGCIGLCDPRCSLVPVQQDEPEGVCAFPNCSCTENRCPGVGGEPCRGCGVPTGVGAYHHIGCRTPEPNPVPVQQDELQITPNKSKDLESGPVQQDEPEDDHWHWLDDRTGRIYHEGDVFGVWSGRDVTLHRLRCTCDPVPEWIVDNAEAKGWDLSPHVASLPRPRPPRSHRDDESLRRWEARHPSVRFTSVPVAAKDELCVHEWRSSFGDTFCVKCNQDAPVEIASERCRTCKGSGTWADEGWSKPPQPCKACSGSGLAPIRKRKPTVPVQQEPELSCEECPRTFRLSQHGERGRSAEMCPQCVADLRIEGRAGVTPVPSVGLRDRLAEALWNAEENQIVRERPVPWAEINGRDCQDREWMYDKADAILSVLHEAGTQEDEAVEFVSHDAKDCLWTLGLTVEDLAHAQAELQSRANRLTDRQKRADYEAMSLRFGNAFDAAAPAVSGTPDTKEDA